MNVIARLEYELAYYDSAVHRFNHYTTRTPHKVGVRWWTDVISFLVQYVLCKLLSSSKSSALWVCGFIDELAVVLTLVRGIVTCRLLKSIILVENAESPVMSANGVFLSPLMETRAQTTSLYVTSEFLYQYEDYFRNILFHQIIFELGYDHWRKT